MREISRCCQCDPWKQCDGTGEYVKTRVAHLEGEVLIKESIFNCPTYRYMVIFIENNNLEQK